MANRRAFEIAFVGLKPGLHEFSYELEDKFFIEKGAEDFTNATAKVKLTLEKNTGFMRLKFEVDGKADVTCDRCGNSLQIDLWDEFKMLVKLVDDPEVMNEQEEDPDIFYISRTDSHLDVSDWLYEFSLLSVPMQKNCGEDEKAGPKCNKEVLDKLQEMKERTAQNESNNLWKGLDQFKKN
ncbi:MAG: DUF177 domain-containing protein [Chitinophagaceae bacterium]|nr:MAG: DUF177 domain-containing protein [Chitinophagaceae bacterium]